MMWLRQNASMLSALELPTVPPSRAEASLPSLLKAWRQLRRLPQLELALAAGVSQRHLSFIESGRSQPSREMVLTLGQALDVPLRERNLMFTAAGFAPIYAEGEGLGAFHGLRPR